MEVKEKIKAGYAKIAAQSEYKSREEQRHNLCAAIYEPIADEYPKFEGYEAEADMGLGCGFPFAEAGIEPGDKVIDLGCASGVDTFIAAEMVGDTGLVIGFDFTPELIARAEKIAAATKSEHLKFEIADINHLPLDSGVADVAISNGVFSLLPDTRGAFVEVYRVLKPGGVFCISDINRKRMFQTETYDRIKEFTCCMNGIRLYDYYIGAMKSAGFSEVEIVNERPVSLPADITEEEGIFITTFKLKK